ncbi:hypothetical protein [Pseudodesulfovibrio alkaliphilus]|uniref:hypothetical protein n=1 Tax=Pseudodesulfovibrio alkaliphilus TaxID=2661613 RepID=UPI001E3434AB|nr:hypothetical protein [Pseudodesulfovibrio alkaliphilus]
MSASSSESGSPQLDKNQRLAAYQQKLRILKERSALREVMERDLLLEFIRVNHGNISEYPLLKAQQASVIELLCARAGHPGYEYIHKQIAGFIVQLGHYEKAVRAGDTGRADELRTGLVNTESMLIKCVQGIVYAMALITDNFEEIVLRYFGKDALREYSALIEQHELDERFWRAFVQQFIAKRVADAHGAILAGERFTVTKEKSFLVIRFLFDDILAGLNPTNQVIEKTRIQKSFIASRTEFEGRRRVKLLQSVLSRGVSELSQAADIGDGEILQAARVTCIDPVSEIFEKLYEKRALARASGEGSIGEDERRQEQTEFRFLLDQVVAVGLGAAIAIGRTSDHFYHALAEFVPDQIEAIRPLAKDFSIPTLEKLLFFLLENHTVHILAETGREEGGKIQVRSGRARRVSVAAVDGLPGMSKIRKAQLFANDATRQGTLLFKLKTGKQLVAAMDMLNLESELKESIASLWGKALFRVDIMVLINLEQVARTTTNLKAKLAGILQKYGVAKRPQEPGGDGAADPVQPLPDAPAQDEGRSVDGTESASET